MLAVGCQGVGGQGGGAGGHGGGWRGGGRVGQAFGNVARLFHAGDSPMASPCFGRTHSKRALPTGRDEHREMSSRITNAPSTACFTVQLIPGTACLQLAKPSPQRS